MSEVWFIHGQSMTIPRSEAVQMKLLLRALQS